MFWNLLLIASGSLVCSVAVNGIILPQQFFGAGFTGVAIIIHYPVPPLPMGGLYLLLNIPVFALGWLYVGRRFKDSRWVNTREYVGGKEKHTIIF